MVAFRGSTCLPVDLTRRTAPAYKEWQEVPASDVHMIKAIRFSTYLNAAAQEITKRRSGKKSRLKLMSAGARLLNDHTFQSLNVGDVCEAAGLAKGNFYLYFKTKEEFIHTLLTEYVGFEAQTIPQLSGAGGPYGSVRSLVSWYEGTFDSNAGVLRCLIQLADTDDEFAGIWQRRNRAIVDAAMAYLVSVLPKPPEDTRLMRMAMQAVGAIMDQSLFARYRIHGDAVQEQPEDARLRVDLHAALMYRAVFGSNPPLRESGRVKGLLAAMTLESAPAPARRARKN